jgi:hypothetical protein
LRGTVGRAATSTHRLGVSAPPPQSVARTSRSSRVAQGRARLRHTRRPTTAETRRRLRDRPSLPPFFSSSGIGRWRSRRSRPKSSSSAVSAFADLPHPNPARPRSRRSRRPSHRHRTCRRATPRRVKHRASRSLPRLK